MPIVPLLCLKCAPNRERREITAESGESAADLIPKGAVDSE
jgi:hypothetical protein